MRSTHPLPPDQARLREHLTRAKLRGRVISHRTAREVASWYAEAVGPGLRTFVATGVVTGRLYTELGRLYDFREPEIERWLDNLTRFVLTQPVIVDRKRLSSGEEANS